MIHTLLKGKKVILASESPRRKKIFKMIGINALQVPSFLDEPSIDLPPHKYVMWQAKRKAEAISKRMDTECIIVAADTIVYQDKQILEKPKDIYQAADYLSRLAGNTHLVYTGVCVIYKNKVLCKYEKTLVEFRPLSIYEIEEYINTSEPMDKAGAYGIQGFGSQFISKITGCYFNVMGFPISLFYTMIQEIMAPGAIE